MTVDKVINIKPKRILVITLRYLGDTLLVTPLLSSLHAAYPEAEIDVLMPVANVSMLEGNSDVHELITLPKKPGFIQFLKILIKLYRKYDLSISTQAGDRPVLAAIIAGKTCIGFVPNKSWKQCWKNGLLTRSLLPTMPQKHSVLENLRFCQVLGIQASYRVTPPRLPKKNVVLLIVEFVSQTKTTN